MNDTKIILIGSGNVAFHLVKMFASHNIIQQILVRNIHKAQEVFKDFSIPIIADYADLKQADIIIIATSDDAIPEISSSLQNTNSLVVHTSGSVSMSAISQENKGVFYPLQTFSIHREIGYASIPFFIEGNSSENETKLLQLANTISKNTQILSSEKRQYVHLSAVWANNFTNANFVTANAILQEQGLSFDVLKPLIQETVSKVMEMSPIDAQTGPAKRNDEKVLQMHHNLLTNNKLKYLYTLLSNTIYDFTHEKL